MPRRKPKPKSPVTPPGTPRKDLGIPDVIKLELDPTIPAWDKQAREGDRHYGMFRMYLEMGIRRSVKSIAELANISEGHVYRLSSAHLWAARAAAHDAEQARLYAAELAESRRQLIHRHLAVSGRMLTKGMEALEALDPTRITARDLAPFLGTAAEMGRRALGMDAGQMTNRTEVTVGAAAAVAGGQPEGSATVEVAVMYEQILASLDTYAAQMSPEQLEAAAAQWRTAGNVIEGEVA